MPSLDSPVAISNYFDVSVDELIGRKPAKYQQKQDGIKITVLFLSVDLRSVAGLVVLMVCHIFDRMDTLW